MYYNTDMILELTGIFSDISQIPAAIYNTVLLIMLLISAELSYSGDDADKQPVFRILLPLICIFSVFVIYGAVKSYIHLP